MNTMTAIRIPAGWYPDPVGSDISGATIQSRWWDGMAWTPHTAASQTPVSPVAMTEALADSTMLAATFSTFGTAPVTVSPRESARMAETMPLHIVTPSAAVRSMGLPRMANAFSPISPAYAEISGYEPFAAHERFTSDNPVARARTALHLRVYTVSIWLMATMPITQALLVFWVFTMLPAESSAWTRALAIAFPFVLSAALAGQDTRLMELSGHLRTAPWITALLTPPIYLALRGVRVARTTGAAPWPLIVWATAQLAVVGVWWMLDPEGVLALIGALA